MSPTFTACASCGTYVGATSATELALESAHQPMKQFIIKGNGHDDAGQAMRQMQQTEFFSRLALSPAYVGVHETWVAHGGVQLALLKALPLVSHASKVWRAHAKRVPTCDIPADGRLLGESFVSSTTAIVWRSRVSRGGVVLRVHDSVSVLVSGPPGLRTVHTHDVRRGESPLVAFFFVVGLFTVMHGPPCAIVQSYEPVDVGHVFRRVQGCRLFLRLKPTVRRALVVHRCGAGCEFDAGAYAMKHSLDNAWWVLSRSEGYPARSA